MRISGLGWIPILILAVSSARAACLAPVPPTIQSSPTSVGVAQPYAIQWSNTAGPDGYYIVERSTSSTFAENYESQFVSLSAASFIGLAAGGYFHRVTAVAGCDSSVRSAASVLVPVTVVGAPGGVPISEESAPYAITDRGLLAAAPSGEPMFVVPDVANIAGAGGAIYKSRLRINNTSTKETTLDLGFVPFGSDANSGVITKSVTIAANGTLAFDDVLGQFFGLTGVFGNLEIRSSDRSVQVLTSSAPVYSSYSSGKELDFFSPILQRSEGARLGVPQTVPGAVVTNRLRSVVRFVETERTASTTLTTFTARLVRGDGQVVGSSSYTLRSGEMKSIVVGPTFGVSDIPDGSLTITVDSGNGTVAALLRQFDNATGEQPRSHVSERIEDPLTSKVQPEATTSKKLHALVGVIHGKPADAPVSYRTLLGIAAPKDDATVTISLLSDRALAAPHVTTTVRATQTLEFPDALQQLFKLLPDVPTRGTILVETTGDIVLYGSLTSPDRPVDSPTIGNLPSIPLLSDSIIGATAGIQRPVYFAGAEQFVDALVGRRWKLELTELGGAPSTVTVLLYEAADRKKPVAQKEFSLSPRQHLVLDTVFSALGLDEPPPAADRKDVQIVVVPKSGLGRVTAIATGMYVQTGEQTKFILTPSGGIPSDGKSLAAPILPPITHERHRPVRRQ